MREGAGGGTVFNYENVQGKAVVLISTGGTGWYREWYNDENGCTKRYRWMCGAIASKKQTHGVGRNVSILHFIYSRGASRAIAPVRADVKQISENLPYCSAFSEKEGLSAYLLFGTSWLGSARLGSAWLAGWLETLFYPPIPRLNAMEMGGGGRKKVGRLDSLMLHSPGPLPRAFSPVN